MADLNVGALKGSIQVDFGSVRKAEQAVKSLQGQFSSYVKAANKAASSEKARIRALGQVESNLKKLSATQKNQVNATKDSNAAISRAVSATKSYQAVVEGYGASSTEAVKAQVRMKSAIEDANSSVKAATNNAKAQVAAHKENVRVARDVAKETAAKSKVTKTATLNTKQYEAALTRSVKAETQIRIARRNSAAETVAGERALEKANMALKQYRNLLAQSDTTVDQLAKAQGNLTRQIEHARVTTTGLNQSTANARSWFRSSRAAASQFGLQLQDVAVQAQSSTHWLVILGQQGSQLLGFFGAGGAFAGALLAVGAAVAYLGSSTKEAEDSTSALDDTLSKLDTTFDNASGAAAILSEEIREYAKVSRDALVVKLQEQLSQTAIAGEQAAKAIRGIAGQSISNFSVAAEEYAYLKGNIDSVTGAGSNLQRTLRTVSSDLGVNRGKVEMLFDAYNRLNVDPSRESFLELNSVLRQINDTTDASNIQWRQLSSALVEQSVKAIRAIERGEDLEKVLSDVDTALKRTKDSVRSSGMAELRDELEGLISSYDESYAKTIKLNRAWMILAEAGREFGIEQSKLIEIMDNYKASLNETSEETKKASDEAAEYIARLKEEAETVSLSEKGMVNYTIEKLASKDASIQNKEALIEEGRAYVQQVKNAERRLEQMEEEQERRKRLLEQQQKDYKKRQQFMFGGQESELMTQQIELRQAGVDEKAIQEFAKRQQTIINENAKSVATSPFGDIETLELELAQREQKLIEYLGREKAITSEHWKTLQKNAATAKPFLQIASGMETASNIMSNALTVMQTANRKNTDEYKAMAMTQAIISGALAVTKIWGAHADNYWLASGLTALVGAQVGAQIAAIESANYATGGLVRGPGTGTSDDVPANLSNGEFVMRADAVRKIGIPQLNAMNQGRTQNFATGGAVSTGSSMIGGGNTTVNVIDNRSQGAPVETRETTDEKGDKQIELIIQDVVKKGFGRGTFDKDMKGNFGIKRPGRRV